MNNIELKYPGIETTAYYKYAVGVVNDEIVAGRYIKLACLRFLDDLNDDRYYLDMEKILNLIDFIALLKHYKGLTAGNNFILLPWQLWIAANIFGLYIKSNNKRKYYRSYILIARKNGKDATMVAFALYAMIADGESSPEVLFGANSREQARIAFDMATLFCKLLDSSNRFIKVLRSEIRIDEIAGILKVISSDSSKLDGFNPSFAIVDEYHESPDPKMVNVITSGMGARLNPHLCIITTAGFDLNSPCYELRCYCCEVLNKEKEDLYLFAAIYELDDDDNWELEKNWIKSNPNLNVSISIDNMNQYIQAAKNTASDWVNTLTKNLNKWLSSSTKWIDLKYFKDHLHEIDLNNYYGQDCWIGLDLSSTNDLTAMAVMLRPDEYHVIYKVFYYLPKATIDSHKNRFKYQEWVRKGHLIECETELVDYNMVLRDIKNISEVLNIQNIYYDKWNSSLLINSLKKEGFNTLPFLQSCGNYNLAMKQFEADIKFGYTTLDKNPINLWCISNTTVHVDKHGNCMPDKGKAGSYKIDGVCAMLFALGGKLYDDEANICDIAI